MLFGVESRQKSLFHDVLSVFVPLGGAKPAFVNNPNYSLPAAAVAAEALCHVP